MELRAYQQRVVVDKAQLDEKITGIRRYMETEHFTGLDDAERDRMARELAAREALSAILGERIAAFT